MVNEFYFNNQGMGALALELSTLSTDMSTIHTDFASYLENKIHKALQLMKSQVNKIAKNLKLKMDRSTATRRKEKESLEGAITTHEKNVKIAIKRKEANLAILLDPWLSEQTLQVHIGNYVKVENSFRLDVFDNLKLITNLDRKIAESLLSVLVDFDSQTKHFGVLQSVSFHFLNY
jgi:hypothetical protein